MPRGGGRDSVRVNGARGGRSLLVVVGAAGGGGGGIGAAAAGGAALVGITVATGAAGNLLGIELRGANFTARGFRVGGRDWPSFSLPLPTAAVRPIAFEAALPAPFFFRHRTRITIRATRRAKPTKPTTRPTIRPV